MSGEQAAVTLLPLGIAQIGAALVTTGFGVVKELHYVSAITMILNILGVFFVAASVDINSYPFAFGTSIGLFMLGLLIIARDLHHNYKNEAVAFIFGSKTLGAIGIWVGFTQNNWITIFQPVADGLVVEASRPASDLLAQLMGLFFILVITHVLGAIFWYISKQRYG